MQPTSPCWRYFVTINTSWQAGGSVYMCKAPVKMVLSFVGTVRFQLGRWKKPKKSTKRSRSGWNKNGVAGGHGTSAVV